MKELDITYNEYINLKDNEKNNIDVKISKMIDYNEIKKSGDYIFNGDVSSLYPIAMRGNELLRVLHPLGCSRWSEDPKKNLTIIN